MTVLLLLAVVVLVLLNGFFVAAEFALVRVRRSRIEEEVEEGVKGARLVLTQLEDLSRFLGEPAIASIFENLLGDSVPHGVSLAISLALAYVISTSLHITVGEQVPKIYAINRAEGVARRIARPLQWFTSAFSPFIHVLNAVSNGMLRVI